MRNPFDLKEASKIAIEECQAQAIARVKEIIFDSLGMEVRWSEARFKDKSPVLEQLKETPEYNALKDGLVADLVKLLPTDILTKAQQKELIRELQSKIFYRVKNEYMDAIVDQYAKQSLEIIAKDPVIAPQLVAAKMIAANTPKKKG